VLKIFSGVLQQNRRSGFGSLQRKGWEPLMQIMKATDDSTHPCRSPTPKVNGRDLTRPTWTQTPEQEYSELTASNRRPSTPYTGNTPHSFSEGTRSYVFSRSTKHVYTFLAYCQYFSKFYWRVKFWSVVLRPRRKPHWVSFSFYSTISRHLFSRHLAT